MQIRRCWSKHVHSEWNLCLSDMTILENTAWASVLLLGKVSHSVSPSPSFYIHLSLSLSVISVQFICISSSLWGTDQMIKDPLIFPIRPTCLCFPQSSWKYTLHTLVMNTASEEHTVCWWISPPLPARESVDSLGIILHERSDPQVYILKVLIWNANRENALSNKLQYMQWLSW